MDQRGRDHVDQPARARAEAAREPSTATPNRYPSYPAAMLTGQALQRDANQPVRAMVMWHLQHTIGNRDARRFLQRATTVRRDATTAAPAAQSPAQRVEAAWSASHASGSFVEPYRILDSLPMAQLLTTLTALMLPIGITRLIGNMTAEPTVRRDRLLAAMFTILGRTGAELETHLAKLPPAEQTELRDFRSAQQGPGAALKQPELREAQLKAQKDLHTWLEAQTKKLTKRVPLGIESLFNYVVIMNQQPDLHWLTDAIIKGAIMDWAARHNLTLPTASRRPGRGIFALTVDEEISDALQDQLKTKEDKPPSPETETKADKKPPEMPIVYSYSLVLNHALGTIGSPDQKVSADLLADQVVGVDFDPPLTDPDRYKMAASLIKLHVRLSKVNIDAAISNELKGLTLDEKLDATTKLQVELTLGGSFSLVVSTGLGAVSKPEQKPDPGKVGLGKGLGAHWSWSPLNAALLWKF